MATQKDFEDVFKLIGLSSALNQDDFGRNYGGSGSRRRAQEFAALGGDARLDQLMADPDVIKYVRANTLPGGGGGGFLGGLIGGITNFMGEAGIKEGLMLGGLAGGLNALGAFGAPASAASTGIGAGALPAGATSTATGLQGLIDAGVISGTAPIMSAGYAAPAIATAGGLTATEAAQLAAQAIPSGGATSSVPVSGLAGLTSSLPNTLGSIASGAAALYGANQAASSAADAAAIQRQSTDAALAEQKRQFDLAQAAQTPWRTAGEKALGEQVNLMGLGEQGAEGQLASLTASPGYGFRLGEGLKALERSAAARGGLFSGGAGKALTRYGQDYATNEYGNRLAQLSSLSGQGQAAASGQAGLGMQYGGNVSNLLTGMGNAAAASNIAQGAARQSGILGAGQALSNLFNPPKQQPTLKFTNGQWTYA